MKTQLIFPMAFYVLYIWCVTLYMFRVRIRAVKSGEVAIRYFKAYTGAPPTERTQLVARHYDNQFQVPMLFFAVGILHTFVARIDTVTVVLAWVFVLSRLAHAWVHLGSNRIQHRFKVFAAGWIVILLLWAQLVYFSVQ